jgi:hypothetical protein
MGPLFWEWSHLRDFNPHLMKFLDFNFVLEPMLKVVMNSSGNKKIHAANENAPNALQMLSFFFLS